MDIGIPNKRRGFTILELIIVVVIIAVIASLAIPKMQIMIERSRSVEALRYLQTVRGAIEECRLAHGGRSYDPQSCLGPLAQGTPILNTGIRIRDIESEVNSHFRGANFFGTWNGGPTAYTYCVSVWRNSRENAGDPGGSVNIDIGAIHTIPSGSSSIFLCSDDLSAKVKIFGSGWYEGIGGN